MMLHLRFTLLVMTILGSLLAPALGQVGVQFDAKGMSSLKYNGEELLWENDGYGNTGGVIKIGSAAFYRTDGTSWAGSHYAKKIEWDASQQRYTLRFDWGRIVVVYETTATRLTMRFDVYNDTSDTLEAIQIHPLVLQFVQPPRSANGVVWDGNPVMRSTMGEPSLIDVHFDDYTMVLVNDDISKPLMVGFPGRRGNNQEANLTYAITCYTGTGWHMPTSLPKIVRPIGPGLSDHFDISLRFAPPQTDAIEVAPEVLESQQQNAPFTLNWPDRRPIGSLFVAGNTFTSSTNPRGWLSDRNININSLNGRVVFQNRLMSYAQTSIAIAKDMNAQGVIFWNIEGEQFPNAVYVGDPSQISPEMERVIDDFIKKFRDAGLRVGFALRPQRYMTNRRSAWQEAVSDPVRLLDKKISYAKERWGATLFYIDSNTHQGQPLDAVRFGALARKHSDVLLIPEHSKFNYYAYCAPYAELRTGDYRTPDAVLDVYPQAFRVSRVSDGDVAMYWPGLVEAVRRGEILLYQTWWNNPENVHVKAIYQAAQTLGLLYPAETIPPANAPAAGATATVDASGSTLKAP